MNLFEDVYSTCIKDVFEYYDKEKALVLIIIAFVLLKQRCLNLFEDVYSTCIKDVLEYYDKKKALVFIIIAFVLLKQRC